MADLDYLALLDELQNPAQGWEPSELDKIDLPQITRENTMQGLPAGLGYEWESPSQTIGRSPASANPISTWGQEDIVDRIKQIRREQAPSQFTSPGIGTLQDKGLPPSTQRWPEDKENPGGYKNPLPPEPTPLTGKALAEKVVGKSLNPMMNTYPKTMEEYERFKEQYNTGMRPSALDKLAELTGYKGVLGTDKKRTFSSAEEDIPRRTPIAEKPPVPVKKEAEEDSSTFLGIEKTSPRGWGTSLGMGLAALGDAFSQGGGGKGGFLNRIEDQRKFYESEFRKMYDAEQRHNLAKWTQQLAAKGRSATLKQKKKEFEAKTRDDQYNDPRVESWINSARKNPKLKFLVDMYDTNPADFVTSHTMNDVKGLAKGFLAADRRARSRRKDKKMTAGAEEAIRIRIKNDRYLNALGEKMFNKDFLTRYTGKELDEQVLPALQKKQASLQKAYDKDLGGKRGEALNNLITSFNPLFSVIEKYNNLKPGTLTYKNAPKALNINTSTGEVLLNGKLLKFPSTMGGLFIDDKGISDWLGSALGRDQKVSDKEFIGALEGIYSSKRLNDAGKALTAIELKNFKKQMQMIGMTNMGQVMSGVMQLRNIYQKAKLRMEDNFLKRPYAPEYFRIRQGSDLDAEKERNLSKPGAVYEAAPGEPRMGIYNMFRSEALKGKRAWLQNPRLTRYVSDVKKYFRSDEAKNNPWYFNPNATQINKRFIRQDKLDALSPQEMEKIKTSLMHQDNWPSSKIFGEFSRLGVVK